VNAANEAGIGERFAHFHHLNGVTSPSTMPAAFDLRGPAEPSPAPIREPDPPENPDVPIREPDPAEPGEI